MTTFIIAFFGFTALQLVLGSPIFYFTWRSGRRAIARRFLQSAIVVGAICAVFSASSERLVNQCREANNLAVFRLRLSGNPASLRDRIRGDRLVQGIHRQPTVTSSFIGLADPGTIRGTSWTISRFRRRRGVRDGGSCPRRTSEWHP